MTAPTTVPRGPLEIATLAELDEGLRKSLAPDAGHRAVLQQLVSASKFAEAVKFLAFSLPRREGVWWAWVTAKRAEGAGAPPAKASLDATEQWISQPTDAKRRKAFELAEQADIGTPAGCAGAAAFFAGESIAPPNVQAVPPGPYDCNKMIANAVILSAVLGDPDKSQERFLLSLQQGLEVIGRIKVWPEEANATLVPPSPPAKTEPPIKPRKPGILPRKG